MRQLSLGTFVSKIKYPVFYCNHSKQNSEPSRSCFMLGIYTCSPKDCSMKQLKKFLVLRFS